MTRNLGPKQQSALWFLACRGPYASVNRLARQVGPHRSARYGRATIARLRDRGLIAVDPAHPAAARGSRGAVVLTPAGEAAARRLFAGGDGLTGN